MEVLEALKTIKEYCESCASCDSCNLVIHYTCYDRCLVKDNIPEGWNLEELESE